MLGERALRLLSGLSRGEPVDPSPKELQELQDLGLIAVTDEIALGWARDHEELSKRYEFESSVEAGRALAKLQEKLRSDIHRMATRDSVLRTQELDAARLRRLVGVLEDAALAPLLVAARTVLATKTNVQTTRDGRPLSLTARGVGAEKALAIRLARYEKKPLSAFVRRFVAADEGMQAIAAERAFLMRELDLPKGKDAVALGLLKLGMPAQQAIATFRSTKAKVRLGPANEAAHVAVTFLRNRKPDEPPGNVAGRLQKARDLLKGRSLGSADLVRGAAKSLLAFPNLDEAADRFSRLVYALQNQELDSKLDGSPVRYASRLISASGTPVEIAARCAAAARLLDGRQPPHIGSLAVALAGATTSLEELPAALARYGEILMLLSQKRPSPGDPLDCVSDLIAYKGTPVEVVDLVTRLAEKLSGEAFVSGWATKPSFEAACGLAKRFSF